MGQILRYTARQLVSNHLTTDSPVAPTSQNASSCFCYPEQDRERISLVVILWMKATSAHRRYNGGFIRITAACDVTLDRTDGNTLVGDPMLFAKSAKGRKETPIGVRCISACMCTHLLEINGINGGACL